jgi:hypothetical protein
VTRDGVGPVPVSVAPDHFEDVVGDEAMRLVVVGDREVRVRRLGRAGGIAVMPQTTVVA